jgi:hypothetical protein
MSFQVGLTRRRVELLWLFGSFEGLDLKGHFQGILSTTTILVILIILLLRHTGLDIPGNASRGMVLAMTRGSEGTDRHGDFGWFGATGFLIVGFQLGQLKIRTDHVVNGNGDEIFLEGFGRNFDWELPQPTFQSMMHFIRIRAIRSFGTNQDWRDWRGRHFLIRRGSS